MERLITRKEAAQILGISIATLDAARNNGQISYVQYVPNGCVFFTDSGLQEYVAKCTLEARRTGWHDDLSQAPWPQTLKSTSLLKIKMFGKTKAQQL